MDVETFKIAQAAVASISQLPEEVKFILEEIRLRDEASAEIEYSIDGSITDYLTDPTSDPFGFATFEDWIEPHVDKISELSEEKILLAQQLVRKLERKEKELSLQVERYVDATGGTLVREESPSGSPVPPTTLLSTPRMMPPQSPLVPFTPPQALSPSMVARVAAVTNSSVMINPSAGSSPRRQLPRRASVTTKKDPIKYMIPPLPKPRVYRGAASQAQPELLPDALQMPPPSVIPAHGGTYSPHFASSSPSPSPKDLLGMEISLAEQQQTEDEEDEEDEDTSLYCFCRQVSHGEMILCDSKECPLKWFHLECIGRSQPPPKEEKWYCSQHCASRSPSQTYRFPSTTQNAFKTVDEELLKLNMSSSAVGFEAMPEPGPSKTKKRDPEPSEPPKKRSPKRNRKKKI
ncbi:hypothetical protein FRB90_011692 [Tulasnella sp. 427]|nr:hypothetical protein FRB90_011692 [Tulasnella sp. 427]